MPIIINGEEIYSCPRRPLKDNPLGYSELFGLFQHYKNGFLPEGGGIMDQSPKLMNLLSICDMVVSEIEQQKIEEQKTPKGRPQAPIKAGRGDPRKG